MEKFKKFLLLIINIFIDIFLISLAIVLLLWMIFKIPPEKSVQSSFSWIQESWDALWGIEVKERDALLSKKFYDRAHRHIYVETPKKRGKREGNIITQPYK